MRRLGKNLGCQDLGMEWDFAGHKLCGLETGLLDLRLLLMV